MNTADETTAAMLKMKAAQQMFEALEECIAVAEGRTPPADGWKAIDKARAALSAAKGEDA